MSEQQWHFPSLSVGVAQAPQYFRQRGAGSRTTTCSIGKHTGRQYNGVMMKQELYSKTIKKEKYFIKFFNNSIQKC